MEHTVMSTAMKLHVRVAAECDVCGDVEQLFENRVGANERIPVFDLPHGWRVVTRDAWSSNGAVTTVVCPKHEVNISDPVAAPVTEPPPTVRH